MRLSKIFFGLVSVMERVCRHREGNFRIVLLRYLTPSECWDLLLGLDAVPVFMQIGRWYPPCPEKVGSRSAKNECGSTALVLTVLIFNSLGYWYFHLDPIIEISTLFRNILISLPPFPCEKFLIIKQEIYKMKNLTSSENWDCWDFLLVLTVKLTMSFWLLRFSSCSDWSSSTLFDC